MRFRRLTRLATAAALVAAPTLASALPAAAATGITLNPFEARLVVDVNAARAHAGLPPLTVAGGTTEVARTWTGQLAAAGALSHNPNLVDDLASHGSPNWTFAAENVGFGPASSADTLFTAYMNSAPHRANILAPQARYLGVGAVSTNLDGAATEFNTLDFVDSYSGPGVNLENPLATRAASSASDIVDLRAGIAQFSTLAGGGATSTQPYFAPTTLGTAVRWAMRAGRTGGVAFLGHDPMNLTGRGTLSLHVAASDPRHVALPAIVYLATPNSRVRLGVIDLTPGPSWVGLVVPAADRVSGARLTIFIPSGELAAVGGSATVALYEVRGE
ncbi:MAG TPA: CAP domain-containing protein [Mycobacteriales bacterium]|nr:CAP domain-containing protein [Mycobacteriales bacterium]